MVRASVSIFVRLTGVWISNKIVLKTNEIKLFLKTFFAFITNRLVGSLELCFSGTFERLDETSATRR